ncbi:TIGR00159 family protein, partial [Rhizobium leguminosarum]|nr:TIGR00159 family protein [Rhizobium leguminosarum]
MIAYNLGLSTIKPVDIIDILLVSLLIYQLYKLIKGSVAVKTILGFLTVYLISWLADKAGMRLLGQILRQITGISAI